MNGRKLADWRGAARARAGTYFLDCLTRSYYPR